ncbi:MAG TPA: protein kinase, partial [Planctomycetota bacterium]|nr:protein kinase [Planctomycetota bacterium]
MTGPQDSSDGGQQLLLGKKLLEKGLITPDQLREALVERARHVAQGDKSAAPLGGILVAKGFITDRQLAEALDPAAAAAGPASDGFWSEAAPEAPSATVALAPPSPAAPTVSLPPPEPRAPTGPTRLGKYALLGELGRGGMGVVYEALDTQLNRKVALKLMLANPNMDPRERQLELDRFVQEAQLSAKLKHPNIVAVYEAGVLEGRQYLAMELVEGKAFSDWKRESSLREQVTVIRDVASAVHHAHEQGILHRDLKPRNILVSPGPRAFVTDFGLAKSLGKNVNLSLTGSGAVVGTPAYMSPEQAQGLERVDWRTDIWSLGVILYEVMTGRTPFTGDSPIEILMKVVKDPVVPPLQVSEATSAIGLDKTIENICLKALAKKDKDRYVTAQAFAEDLTKWLSGEQVKVQVAKPRRRSPHLRLYAATLGVLVALAGGLYWLGTRPSSHNVREELARGREALAQGEPEAALAVFRLALRKDPSNAEAIEGEKAALQAKAELERKREETLRQKLAALGEELQRGYLEVIARTTEQDAARSKEERERIEAERTQAMKRVQKLQEEAELTKRKLQENIPPVPVKAGAGSDGPKDGWSNAVNLLAPVDPVHDAVWGTWALQNGRLESDRADHARLELPFVPPQEYDLRVTFSRLSGTDAVILVVVGLGRSFALEIGGRDNTQAAFTELKAADPAPARATADLMLENDRPYTAVVEVRRDGVKARLDGQELCAWKSDFSDLRLPAAWTLRSPGMLGLGSQRSPTAFHRVELLEREGRCRRRPPNPPKELPKTAVVPGSMRPGLIGEYFHGTSFEALAVRQIDPAVGFDWRQEPAWPSGPADAFSARWTGFLHVPRGGLYRLALRTDDEARLFLEGVQILALPASARTADASATVSLGGGYYRMVLEMADHAFVAGVTLLWSEGAEAQLQPVPPRHFFHTTADFRAQAAGPAPEFLGDLRGHSNSVTSLSFSQDGRRLASGSEDRRVRIWEVESLRDLGIHMAHPGGVLSVAFSPDGRLLATGAWDGRVRLWDLSTAAEVRAFEGHSSFIQSLAFGARGLSLASGSHDRTARLWDVEAGKEVRRFA